MSEVACRNCHFYDKGKQVCNNPNRNDVKLPYYYGCILPDDYCTLFMPEVNVDVSSETV